MRDALFLECGGLAAAFYGVSHTGNLLLRSRVDWAHSGKALASYRTPKGAARLYGSWHSLLQFRRISTRTPENYGENNSREAGLE